MNYNYHKKIERVKFRYLPPPPQHGTAIIMIANSIWILSLSFNFIQSSFRGVHNDDAPLRPKVYNWNQLFFCVRDLSPSSFRSTSCNQYSLIAPHNKPAEPWEFPKCF